MSHRKLSDFPVLRTPRPPVFEAHFLGPEHLLAHSSLSALLACVWSKISSSETIGSLTRSKVTAACFQRWHTES